MMNAEIKRALRAVVASTVITFVVAGSFGTLFGIADPDGGWAAWRVGLLVGSIAAAAVMIIGMIAAFIWLDEKGVL